MLQLLYNAAGYAWRKGNVSDAEQLSVRSMKVRKKLLGKEDKDTLRSIEMAGPAAALVGRWREAEELFADHPDTLSSMANLAFTFKSLGKVKQAFSSIQDFCRLREAASSKHSHHQIRFFFCNGESARCRHNFNKSREIFAFFLTTALLHRDFQPAQPRPLCNGETLHGHINTNGLLL